jgi:hypothetical protein
MSTTEQTATLHHSSLVKAADVDADVFYDTYMNILLTITSSSTTPSNILINVGGYPGDNPVVFSLGDVSTGSAGLQISQLTPGGLPLSTINVTPNTTTLQTASTSGGGNQWTTQLQGYLGAPRGTQNFMMYVIATDSSTTVQVSLNNGMRTTLGQNPIKFSWSPIN